MIIGIGSDIIRVARIRNLLINNRQRFLARIFTKDEIKLAEKIDKIERLSGYVAKRFAAKEACAKALGTGIGAVLGFYDMEIFQDERGKPYIKFSAKINDRFKNMIAHLSLADEREYAQAFVILEN